MPFCGTTSFHPQHARVPYARVLRAWTEAEFRPKACRAALEQLIAAGDIAEELVDPAQLEHGGVAATAALLYGAFAPDRSWLWTLGGAERLSFEIEPEDVGDVATLIRAAVQANDARVFREMCDAELDADLVEHICKLYLDDAPHGLWPEPGEPGILRREHASLFFRSREASIVTDPQALQLGWTTNLGRYPADGGAVVDVVALTHGHDDHWHLPSVLRVTDPERTLVITPQVPRANLLCPEDFRASLTRVGQRAIAPSWYSSVTVADVEIDVLPFYGEQPTRSAPGADPSLRNWGSCYRFTCADYSAMILVDSGADPAGDALEVVERSVAQRGPVDVLLSCCLSFPEAINDGLPHYAFALPFSRLEQIYRDRKHGKKQFMTLGVDGVAEACRISGARWFLPYAHGFSGLGRDPRSEEGEGMAEKTTMAALCEALRRRGTATVVGSWKPGDVARLTDGALGLSPTVAP
jgi:hypothetical protein